MSEESYSEFVRRRLTEAVLPSANSFAARLFARLSSELSPQIAFVLVPTDPNDAPPFAVGIGTESILADLEPSIAAEVERVEASKLLFTGLPRTHAVGTCLRSRVEADSSADMHWHVSMGSHRSGFDCVALVGLPRGMLARVPSTETKRFGKTSLAHSLMHVLAQALADQLGASEGIWKSFHPRDSLDDFLRDAGEHFMFVVGGHLHERGLGGFGKSAFERINRIAALPYEGADGRGSLVFARTDDPELQRTLTFARGVPLRDAVWARKMLELATPTTALAASDLEIHGLLDSAAKRERYWIEFVGRQTWQLWHQDTPLMRTRLGVPGLPEPPLTPQRFSHVLTRLFPSTGLDHELLWSIVDRAREQAHGTMLVFSNEAADEAARLSAHGTPVEVVRISEATVDAATRIDGAVMLDLEGQVHAIGVILDGAANVAGVPSRGARFNSALRYVTSEWAPPSLVVVISEDGHVDLFPRLRPQIRRADLDELIDLVRRYPEGKRMSDEARAACRRLAQNYAEYVPSELWDSVMNGAFDLSWILTGEEEPRWTPYEVHSSDVIENAEQGSGSE
jgi:hypothetical protein